MTGRFNESLDSFEKVTMLDPKNPAAWYGQGLVLVALDRFQEALKCFDKVIELENNNVDAIYARNLTLSYLDKSKN